MVIIYLLYKLLLSTNKHFQNLMDAKLVPNASSLDVERRIAGFEFGWEQKTELHIYFFKPALQTIKHFSSNIDTAPLTLLGFLS